MFNFLADSLDFFYEIWPSFGGAIILFTLAIMLVLSPLSIKSARGMIRMQRLQPELKKPSDPFCVRPDRTRYRMKNTGICSSSGRHDENGLTLLAW